MKLNTDKAQIFTTDDGWSLNVGHIDVLASLKWLRGYPDGRQVWEAITHLGGGQWLRLRASATPGSSTVKFWAR